MKVIAQSRAGEPLDTLELVDFPEMGLPGNGEVLVDIKLAPIHFGDLFLVRSYVIHSLSNVFRTLGIESGDSDAAPGERPGVNVAPRRGSEAYGVVRAVGANVPDNIRVGSRVATIVAQGTWGENIIAPALCVIPTPDGIPDETAAQLFVNAITALMVYRDIRRSVPDEALRQGMVILTAAGTAVARMLARFMADDGLSVIGLTRSSDGASRAGALAPDITFLSTSSPDWKEGVRAAASGRPIVAIADCVSGALIGEVAELLQDDGVISVYGGLASEPLGLTGLQIASRGLQIRGVTLGRWFTATEDVRQADIAAAIDLALRHPNLFPVAALVPLESFRDAVGLVERPGRNGGVLLKI